MITNIIAPYRLATFAELAQAVELSVLFCDQGGGAGLDWRLSVDDYPFDAEILGGVSWHRPSARLSRQCRTSLLPESQRSALSAPAPQP